MTTAAHFYRRFLPGYVRRVTPLFRRYLAAFQRQLDAGPYSLLGKERYGADILQPVYGLHAQALALQGLRAMAATWEQTGHPLLADEAAQLAGRLDAGLRAAVRSSRPSSRTDRSSSDLAARPLGEALRLADRLEARQLLEPGHALRARSGFFRPGSHEAQGILRYMFNHGSRLLGMVRSSRTPVFATPATSCRA